MDSSQDNEKTGVEMRELKFRAWDKCINKILDVANINFVSCAVNYYGVEHVGNIGNHCCILMQFTGLNDRNGKEVFEGDIVDQWGDKRKLIIIENLQQAHYMMSEATLSDSCEVVGNIYTELSCLHVHKAEEEK